MIKVMVVDDEEWIRLGLREQINWCSLGMVISGEASNGAVALEMIRAEPPHIILTDIRMPVMDGIELMERVHNDYPDILIIVISGYSEFEYARKAISFNAFDYVLKPIEEPLLEEVLVRAKEKIRESEYRKRMLLDLEITINESIPIVRDKLLSDLINGRITDFERFDDSIKKLNIHLDMQNLSVMVIKVVNLSQVAASTCTEEADAASFTIMNILDEKVKAEGIPAVIFGNYSKPNEYIIITGYCEKAGFNIPAYMISLARQIKQLMENTTKFKIFIGIGRIYCGIEHIKESYCEAVEAIQKAGMICEKGIAYIDDIVNSMEYYIYPDDKEKAFLYCIESGYKQQAYAYIDNLFSDVLSRKTNNPESVKTAVLGLLVGIDKILKKYNRLLNELLGKGRTILHYVEEVDSFGTLKDWFKQITDLSMDYIQECKKNGTRRIVDEIVDYIRSHYNEDISLNSVAERFFINPAYLSRAFKAVKGQNFNDFLNSVRMKQAEKLLMDSELKMNDISQIVGFDNVNYFFRKFKEYFGCTPSEYKKKKVSG